MEEEDQQQQHTGWVKFSTIYNPCELREAGVFLPLVSAEMASAVAVAAKD